MITLTDFVPPVAEKSAEWIKIRCNFECYPDNALFWVQDEGKCYISLTDGNMIIYNIAADLEELREFVEVISPCCIYSDLETLKAIDKEPREEAFVMARRAEGEIPFLSDSLNSRELYGLLDVEGLSLPEYEYFAVDICRRLNHGFAQYFGKKGAFAAISLNSGNYALMNGIASHKKGMGGIAIKGILALNRGREFLVVCRPAVSPFYLKNGFEFLYKAGYWVKENEVF